LLALGLGRIAQSAALRMIMRMPIAAKMSNFGIGPKNTKAAQLGLSHNRGKTDDVSRAIVIDYGTTCDCLEVLLAFGIVLALLEKRERSVASPELLRQRA
jgi:hypothetical protein